MIKTNKKTIFGMMIVTLSMLGMALFTPLTASAECTDADAKKGLTTENCVTEGDDKLPQDLSAMFKTIANVALFIIGAVSVLMLIYGGIRYTVSGGESSAVTAAKNTILYAIVGVVVALLAGAIINFVLSSFTVGA